MAGERRLNYGADATDAKWRSEHDTTDNRFIVAEDLDGGTILLEYDETATEWVSRGPVNMSGNDVTNVGALDATSVSTGALQSTSGDDIEVYRVVRVVEGADPLDITESDVTKDSIIELEDARSTVELTTNSGTSNTDGYEYLEQTIDATTNNYVSPANSIPLATTSGSGQSGVSGRWQFQSARGDGPAIAGDGVESDPGGKVVLRGFTQSSNDLNDVTLTSNGFVGKAVIKTPL